MNKEEALNEFLRSLRTAFNNALAYQRNHPYFIKSIEEFKLSIEGLLSFLSPIEIDISPKSLSINGLSCDKLPASIELARMLHARRVEKIKITSGFNIAELSELLSALSFSTKDIIQEGGVDAILQKASVSGIFVKSLDYSSLLASQGHQDLMNRWRTFLGSIASVSEADKINDFADSFLANLNSINPKQVAKDEGLRKDLAVFLSILKKTNKEKYLSCLNGLFNYLSGTSSGLSDIEIKGIRELFGKLNEDDFAHILWSNLSKDNPPDPLFFKFFSEISAGAKQNKIAESVASSARAKNDLHLINKIKSLLLEPKSEKLSFAYRNTLASLLKDISTSEDFCFDPKQLRVNYYFILLNMLKNESNQPREKFIAEMIGKELTFILENRDYEYIGYLMDVIEEKKNKPGALDEFYKLEVKILELIEELSWGDESVDLARLSGKIKKSCKDSNFYIKRIFDEGKVTSLSLSLFFRFFPQELDTFYSKLKENRDNLELLGRVIKVSCGLQSELSLLILEKIYSFSSEIMRVEIIKSMQSISKTDTVFLVALLREGSRIMKKEALTALSGSKESIRIGLTELFNIPNFLGRNNSLILENMSIIEELRLKEAVEFLEHISRMPFFWHAPLRKKAQDILKIIK